MPIDNTYRIKVFFTIGTKNPLNIFHYRQTAGFNNADNLADAFDAMFTEKYLDLLSASCRLVKYEVINLDSPTDFYTLSIDQLGHVTGSNMPTHDAISFQLMTNRLDARDGGKRLPGLIESMQNDGDVVGAAFGNCAFFMAALQANLVDTTSDVWRPCVYGGRTGSLGKFANFLSGVSLNMVQTQNTRKTKR